MNGKPTFLRISIVLIIFGLMNLLAMLGRPSVADIRAVDIVHLIGTGMCLGGAIVAFGAHVHSRKST
ncbi:MAG TPA: hypothetical protein VI758_09105 [Bacteroidota bacterium]